MLEADPRPRVALYKAFQRIYDSAHIEVDGDGEGDNLERAAQRRLSTIAPACRQAMLLTTLEGFSPDEAGAIMSRSEEELAELVDEAVTEIERQTATTVLKIGREHVRTPVTNWHVVCRLLLSRRTNLDFDTRNIFSKQKKRD